jgi:C4-type Zn-finger protein
MAGPMDSVGRAAKANMLLIVECGHCCHVGRFRVNDVAQVVGWNKPLEAIKFRCKRCSRKDTTVRSGEPRAPLTQRTPIERVLPIRRSMAM